jgi:peptidoglycan hydrolase-like protein with peptidoglycan-binding domain
MAQFEHNSETFGYINLDGMEGAQKALKLLGHDPGTIDGKTGPNTERAVRSFQASVTIEIDGIVGPETRQALMVGLSQRAAATPAANS